MVYRNLSELLTNNKNNIKLEVIKNEIQNNKKAIQELGDPVYCVGYCNLQNLLRCVDPFAYSTRAEGWACDYYYIHDLIISTGYSPIGRKTDYNLCREYDQKALAIWSDYNLTFEQQKEQVEGLIEEFAKKLTI